MNYRSPLSRARGLGSAGHGTHHWKVQRISAVALVPLALWLVFSLGSGRLFSHEAFVEWLSKPWVPALLSLFFASAYFHASLGVQVIIEDYVRNVSLRVVLILGVKLLLLLMAVSTIVSILTLAL